MIEKLIEFISLNKLNIYAVAQMTEKGQESIRLQPSNACNNSYSVAKFLHLQRSECCRMMVF